MSAGTWESHHAITTLMFRYAECVDTADFEGLSSLFAHGILTSSAADDPTLSWPYVPKSKVARMSVVSS